MIKAAISEPIWVLITQVSLSKFETDQTLTSWLPGLLLIRKYLIVGLDQRRKYAGSMDALFREKWENWIEDPGRQS